MPQIYSVQPATKSYEPYTPLSLRSAASLLVNRAWRGAANFFIFCRAARSSARRAIAASANGVANHHATI